VLWLDDVSSDGIGDNRAYEDLSGVEWPEVEAVVAEEDALLRRAAAQAADADEFDRLLDRELEDRYPGDDFDEGPLSPFIALDVGVISAVAALSASGCVSTTSCRGHRVSGEPSPLVRFTADERRLPVIQAAADHAGCGLLLDQDGMLQLYAADVLAFVAFARELLMRREALDAIESTVAIQRPPEFAGDLETDVRRRDLARVPGATESGSPVQNEAQQRLFDLEAPPDQ
jgi:hypothetical protein